MRHFFISVTIGVFMALPLHAQTPENILKLAEVLALDDIVDVMQEEGIHYGDEMRQDMFPDQSGARWHLIVSVIYDRPMMREVMLDGLVEGLKGVDIAPITTFFSSDLGRRIVLLEIGARRALMDQAIEDVAIENVGRLIENEDPRLELIGEFIEVNELLDSNVVGAMNANYAFYLGLLEGASNPNKLSQDQILADVWSQEQEITDDTNEWLYSYLAMAYQPLSDDDVIAYIAFSKSEAGQVLNRALFEGFDNMFVGISRALGVAAAQVLSGRDI